MNSSVFKINVLIICSLLAFSSNLTSNTSVKPITIKFLSPNDTKYPSYNFSPLSEQKKVRHIIKEIKTNKYLKELLLLAGYTANITQIKFPIYIAIYDKPSPYGVPFVQRFIGRHYFSLNGEKLQGSLFHLSVNDAYGNIESITTGAFQDGFIHEIGHIILSMLVPSYPARTVQTKGVTSVTDPHTAFDEGFAEMLEIFYKYRQNIHNNPQFLANIPFWHQVEFAHLRTTGVLKNLFVWDEWDNARLMRLQTQGVQILKKKNFLPKQKLKTLDQMLNCEGVNVRVLLDILGVILNRDQDYRSNYSWENEVFPAMIKILNLIHQEKITSIKHFMLSIMKSPVFYNYRDKIWKKILETSYFAFASTEYQTMYSKYKEGIISLTEYNSWGQSVYQKTLKSFYVE